MKVVQNVHIVPLTAQGEDATASLDLDSFKMNHWESAAICILFAAALTGNNVLTVNGGLTVGAKTVALSFNYRLGSAAPKNATADVLALEQAAKVATLTLTAATYQGKMLVLELEATDLQSANVIYPWVTVNLDGTASVGTVTAWAVLTGPRYAQEAMNTVIT